MSPGMLGRDMSHVRRDKSRRFIITVIIIKGPLQAHVS